MIADIRQNILKALNKGQRIDGRKHDEFRPVTVEKGVSANAEGSARVKIGHTEVVAGVKMLVERPYPDRPDAGSMMIGVELLPLSNPEFEMGPPGIKAIEIARVVDRGIRESNAIDTKALCIEAGEKVWMVSVDICSMNDEGNLLDASSLATLAAIQDAVFPEFDGKTANYKKKTDKKVPLLKEPIEVTVLKIGEHYIVDPTTDEEKVLDARVTVAVTEDNKICAMQKGGDFTLQADEVHKMVDIAISKTQELRSKL
ncbi:MAG: exosome complex protein Rrp42 [archaeon]